MGQVVLDILLSYAKLIIWVLPFVLLEMTLEMSGDIFFSTSNSVMRMLRMLRLASTMMKSLLSVACTGKGELNKF